MSYEDDRPRSSNSGVLIVLALVGGGLLLGLLVCAGVVYMAVQRVSEVAKPMMAMVEDMQKAPSVIDSFLSDIRHDRPEAAYNSTTEAFQKRMTLEQFKKMVADNPALKEQSEMLDMDADEKAMKPGAPNAPVFPAFRYRYKAVDKDGKNRLEFTISVAKEGEAIKVDQMQVFKAVEP